MLLLLQWEAEQIIYRFHKDNKKLIVTANSTATNPAAFMAQLHLLPLHSSSTNIPYQPDVFVNISGFTYTETFKERDKNAFGSEEKN
jgi:hypothetical protein